MLLHSYIDPGRGFLSIQGTWPWNPSEWDAQTVSTVTWCVPMESSMCFLPVSYSHGSYCNRLMWRCLLEAALHGPTFLICGDFSKAFWSLFAFICAQDSFVTPCQPSSVYFSALALMLLQDLLLVLISEVLHVRAHGLFLIFSDWSHGLNPI